MKGRRRISVKPPKEFATLRVVGIRNSRPKRIPIGRLPVSTSSRGSNEPPCSTECLPSTSSCSPPPVSLTDIGDTGNSRQLNRDTACSDKRRRQKSEKHAAAWTTILGDLLNTYADTFWSSKHDAALCFECWQETTANIHQCPWQVQARPIQGIYPLKAVVDAVVDLPLNLNHMVHCDYGHRTASLAVFDQKARLRECRVQMCDGEPVAVSLLRHHLWAATPTQPLKAVHITLMEQLYECVVGSQISLYRACQALQSCANLHTTSDSSADLYLTVNRFLAFRFFRRFAQEIFFLRDSLEMDCHACPKTPDSGQMFVSMDACFGLVRKLKQRRDHPPKDDPHDNESTEATRFLCHQQEVQEYVRQQIPSDTAEMNSAVDCSSFSAGDTVIAATKNRGLAVKGVFGASCRHQIPLKFMDMHHGERYAYPAYLLKTLCTGMSNIKTTVLYDVACKFSKYFKRFEPELSNSIVFKLPVFHSYAHNLACQLEFNPRMDGSCGLCDGEGQERLWAILQQSSKAMKEMTAPNRHSHLDDLLHHYTAKRNEGISKLRLNNINTVRHLDEWIKQRLAFAIREQANAEKKLREVLFAIDPFVTPTKCDEWLSEIVVSLKLKPTTKNQQRRETEWQQSYVATLSQLQAFRQQATIATSASEKTKLQSDITSTISAAEDIERRHGISERWQCSDILFIAVQDKLRMDQLQPVLQALFKSSAELRQFRELIKKFIPGQDAFNRIKRLVKQSRKSLLSNLHKYNQYAKPTRPKLPENLAEKDICDPESSTWVELQLVVETQHIDPLLCLKLAAIQAHGQVKSAQVEQELLKQDLDNLVLCLKDQIAKLIRKVDCSVRTMNVRYPLYHSHLTDINDRLTRIIGHIDTDVMSVSDISDRELSFSSASDDE